MIQTKIYLKTVTDRKEDHTSQIETQEITGVDATEDRTEKTEALVMKGMDMDWDHADRIEVIADRIKGMRGEEILAVFEEILEI